jgi:ribose transport system permease protein
MMPRAWAERLRVRDVTRLLTRSTDSLILGILVALILIFTFTSPSFVFFSVSNFAAIGANTAEILLLAAGETFIMIAAGIDLSCGAFVVFNSVIFAKVLVAVSGPSQLTNQFIYPHLALALVAAVVAAVLAGLIWGWINGYIAIRWNVPPFIVTLGTLGMSLGAAQIISGGFNVPNVPPQIQSVGVGKVAGIPWILIISVAIVAVLWIVLHGTRFGLRTYAIGSNREAARRAGVNIVAHQIALYSLMGLLTGVVGVLDVARFDTASIAAHTTDNLQAIAAAAIGGVSLYGGKGRMSGTVIGAFIPTVLTTGFIVLGFQPYWQEVAVGAVLVVAVYIDQVRRKAVVTRPPADLIDEDYDAATEVAFSEQSGSVSAQQTEPDLKGEALDVPSHRQAQT